MRRACPGHRVTIRGPLLFPSKDGARQMSTAMQVWQRSGAVEEEWWTRGGAGGVEAPGRCCLQAQLETSRRARAPLGNAHPPSCLLHKLPDRDSSAGPLDERETWPHCRGGTRDSRLEYLPSAITHVASRRRSQRPLCLSHGRASGSGTDLSLSARVHARCTMTTSANQQQPSLLPGLVACDSRPPEPSPAADVMSQQTAERLADCSACALIRLLPASFLHKKRMPA